MSADRVAEQTCPVCGAYPFGCVRGCTARKPWGDHSGPSLNDDIEADDNDHLWPE